jgi:hypothetical protein
MKRLCIIMLIGVSYLAAWSFQKDQSPREFVALDPLGLKYETCTITEWNFISMTSMKYFDIKRAYIKHLTFFLLKFNWQY